MTKPDDKLVERLRLFGVSRPNLGLLLCDEAADEIERLREENARLRGAITMSQTEGCRCQVCGRLYRVDVLVANDLWDRIRPAGRTGEGGLLCGSCIMARLDEALGFSAFRLEVLP